MIDLILWSPPLSLAIGALSLLVLINEIWAWHSSRMLRKRRLKRPILSRRMDCDCGSREWAQIEIVGTIAKLRCSECGHVRLADHRITRPIIIRRK